MVRDTIHKLYVRTRPWVRQMYMILIIRYEITYINLCDTPFSIQGLIQLCVNVLTRLSKVNITPTTRITVILFQGQINDTRHMDVSRCKDLSAVANNPP